MGVDVAKHEERCESSADFDDEHDGIFSQGDGIEFDEAILQGTADDFGVEKRARAVQFGRQQR